MCVYEETREQSILNVMNYDGTVNVKMFQFY